MEWACAARIGGDANLGKGIYTHFLDDEGMVRADFTVFRMADRIRMINGADAARFVHGIGVQWAGKNALPALTHAFPKLAVFQSEQECGDGRNVCYDLQIVLRTTRAARQHRVFLTLRGQCWCCRRRGRHRGAAAFRE